MQFARIVWSSSIFIAFHFCMHFQFSFYILLLFLLHFSTFRFLCAFENYRKNCMSSALFVCAKLRLTFPFPLYITLPPPPPESLFNHYSQERCGFFPFPQFVHPCNCYFSRYLSLAFVAFYRVFQTRAQKKIKPKKTEKVLSQKNSKELEKLTKKRSI